MSASYDSIFRPGLFAGQVHVVTGGGSGIGRCVAHELACLGARVIISGRTAAKLDRVRAEILQDGGTCETVSLDIRDEEAVKAAVTHMVTQAGPIHGLVNNAGGQFPAPLLAISKKGFDAVVGNNLTGGFLMMREVFNQSMQAHGGAIVNMTADFRNGMPGMGHSGAARAGMSNLTQTAAFEWAHAGVRVNAVAPGWIASSGLDSYGGAVQALIPKLKQHVPLRRRRADRRRGGRQRDVVHRRRLPRHVPARGGGERRAAVRPHVELPLPALVHVVAPAPAVA